MAPSFPSFIRLLIARVRMFAGGRGEAGEGGEILDVITFTDDILEEFFDSEKTWIGRHAGRFFFAIVRLGKRKEDDSRRIIIADDSSNF